MGNEIFNFFRRQSEKFITLNPDFEKDGPVLTFKNPAHSQQNLKYYEDYVRDMFRILVYEAHHKGIQEHYDKEERLNYTYNVFLITSLATAYHESILTQFRKIHKTLCRSGSSEKRRIQRVKGVEANKAPWQSLTYNHSPQLIPCQKAVSNGNHFLNQILINQLDLGVMQINMKYHPQMLIPDNFLSVRQNIRHGVHYLYNSHFIRLRNGRRKALCVFRKNGKPNFRQLARASWTGYNSGSQNPCVRLQRNNDPRDKKFLSVLKKISSGTSIYHKLLPKDSLERNVLDEIVKNYNGITANDNVYYRGVITNGSVYYTDNSYTQLLVDEMEKYYSRNNMKLETPQFTHLMKADTVYYYERPDVHDTYLCGSLLNKEKYTAINITRDINRDFYEIELPRYSHLRNPLREREAYLKKGSYAVNIREVPTTRGNRPIKTLKNHDESYKTSGHFNNGFLEIFMENGELAYAHRSLIDIVEKEPKNKKLCEQRTSFYILKEAVTNLSKILAVASLKESIIKLKYRESWVQRPVFKRVISRKRDEQIFIFKIEYIESDIWYEVLTPSFLNLGSGKDTIWIRAHDLKDIKEMNL